jgi:outer membrane protein OmpA-like peptidoglycan-associated protein
MNSAGGCFQMKNCYKILFLLVLTIFIFSESLYADLIVMNNGDKLFGKIQNQNFALYSPYGQIVIRYDFLKTISFDENKPAHVSFQSINNDIFSGIVLVDTFQILLDNGRQKTISRNNIRRMRIDTRGPSYKITTVIFTMGNNDKFSGHLLTKEIKIKSGYIVRLLQSENITRIVPATNGPGTANVLMDNGDILSGELMLERFQVAPDVIGQLTISKSKVSAIQFNAHKMVLNEYSKLALSDMDGDGDGVSDDLDQCLNSPWGYEVDQNGCSTDPNLAKSSNPFDQDNDGVINDMDQCPDTPQGIIVDSRGCSAIKPVLFEFDAYNLQRKFFSSLDLVVSILNKNPSTKIQIQGHTDNIGSTEYNMDLSEKRAQVVKKYLIDKGIDAARISTMGFGYTQNRASNNSPSGRAQNRRAEIVLVE